MKKGILLAIASAFTFSIMNVFVKAASVTIPVSEIVFFRSVIGALLIFLLMRRAQVAFSKKGIPMLVLRGVLGALYLLAYFFTIAHIPLGDASILAHLSPFFAILLSIYFLKERMTRGMLLLFPLFVLGAMFLINPFSYESYTVYALVGVLSAFLAACAATSIRFLTKSHHNYEIVFYFLAAGTIVSLPLMWNEFVVPSLTGWFYLICIGVVSLIGQLVLTSAFTHENIIVVEVVRYIGIFFNVFWGFVFWGEVLSIYSVIGGAIIIGASIALSRKKTPAPQLKKVLT
ncbi:DMT family transporter [Bacillus luteolus]|uniref:DMT family transporter n=1 Tax=Litchfieldia luteola TaxID=682179 RepID=A0ABR9QKY7_9BACI|nr:DMT family transporter [Cytobacillus luteolus]MBE4909162.1 DMT family transporter [Cytobacillus luteolus]MBP1940385.1 drug/metabolite transporter (DMT)-like permease [Cytobacillus luteolus]